MGGVETQNSFVRVGGEGIEEVTDLSEIAEVEAARDSVEAAEGKRIADASAILSALAPAQDDLAVEKEIDVNGVSTVFYIKRLTHLEISRLDAKKYRRGPNGQLVKDLENEETVAVAWLIHTAVVKNLNEGKTLEGGAPMPPNWAPLWTVEQILGGKTPGLMQNPNPAAQDLIYALQAAIWDVVPATNPILAASAANQLGLM